MNHEPIVFIVDDDEQSRKSVCALVNSMGLTAEPHASAEAFLATYESDCPGCLVTDFRMLGMTGLELQAEMNRRQIPLPVIVLTAYPRTQLTVQAIRAGAITLLEKPYENEDLWDAIRRALTEDANRRGRYERREEIRRRIDQLTPAERQVLDMIVQGRPNKAIAKDLDVSLRTVENRRHTIFAKTGTDSVAGLVRLVIEANLNT